MYARRLANEVVARPGEEPCATYDARPLRPASENARVMNLWRALGARDGDDGARGTTRARARGTTRRRARRRREMARASGTPSTP
jgi:hypothetical protein